MPQKHNPVDATGAIASARLAVGVVPVILAAMAQEHERAAGGWQAECRRPCSVPFHSKCS